MLYGINANIRRKRLGILLFLPHEYTVLGSGLGTEGAIGVPLGPDASSDLPYTLYLSV